MLKHALVCGAIVGALYGCALGRYTTWYYEDLCGAALGLLLGILAGPRGSPAHRGTRAGAWVGLATGLPLMVATRVPTCCSPGWLELGLGTLWCGLPCALGGALFGWVCGWLLGQMRSGWLSPLLILWCLPAATLALAVPPGPISYQQGFWCKNNLKNIGTERWPLSARGPGATRRVRPIAIAERAATSA